MQATCNFQVEKHGEIGHPFEEKLDSTLETFSNVQKGKERVLVSEMLIYKPRSNTYKKLTFVYLLHMDLRPSNQIINLLAW